MIKIDLEKWLAETTELDTVQTALSREKVIREMTRTGEDRQTVADFLDAHALTDQDSVLDLTGGEPATLAAALRRYVESLEAGNQVLNPNDEENYVPDFVIEGLHALLTYPWPGNVVEGQLQHRCSYCPEQFATVDEARAHVAGNHRPCGCAG